MEKYDVIFNTENGVISNIKCSRVPNKGEMVILNNCHFRVQNVTTSIKSQWQNEVKVIFEEYFVFLNRNLNGV
jgi:hypothetical protein